MKKLFAKYIINRLFKKSPKAANIASIIAAALLALFFGADATIELCDINIFICEHKDLIYSILLMIGGGVQFTPKKPPKK